MLKKRSGIKIMYLFAIASPIACVTFKQIDPLRAQPKAESIVALTQPNKKIERNTYYVDETNGLDRNLGTSEKLAFKTIERANRQVSAGDTVLVKNGIYNENITIKASGNPDRWIVFKAYPGHKPIVRGTYGAFIVEGNYTKIIGFEVTSTIENGIVIGGQIGGNHHTQILNNRIHDSGCNGIGAMKTDYLTIENNIVYRNAFTGPWMCSGISIYQAQDADRQPGFHNIVRGNISYANENKKLKKDGRVPDGNGIIIDDSQHTQGKPSPKYTNSTLVENNITIDNGGRGIHVFQSDRVTVRNNTTFKNSKSKALYEGTDGEITAFNSNDSVFYNNIAYGRDRSKRTLSEKNSSGNKWDYNLSYNGKIEIDKKVMGRHNTIDVDPLFVNPSIIIDRANFRLRSKSPAINSGTSMSAASIDITGKKRSKRDLGAYRN
jgi:parallel beta-helix repeat protein